MGTQTGTKKTHTLYLGLVAAIVVGAIVAGGFYIVSRFFTNFVISTYYADDKSKSEREKNK